MKFPYVEFESRLKFKSPRKRIIYRPIIPIILLYEKSMILYDCLIDSGADQCVFDSNVADTLRINLKSGKRKPLKGIEGTGIIGYEHTINLRVVGKNFNTKVLFSGDILPNSYGVLGTRGFFDNFDVNFRYREKYFEVF